MIVKDMNYEELVLTRAEVKRMADKYYSQLKEIDGEIESRYRQKIEEGRRINNGNFKSEIS